MRGWSGFQRMSARIGVTMLIVVLALSAVLALASARFSLSALDQSSAGRVDMTAQNLNQSIERLIRYGFTIYNDTDVFRWLYETEKDPMSDILLTNAIRRYMGNEPLLYDLTLYNARTERTYSTLQGVATRTTFRDGALLDIAEKGAGLIRIRRHEDSLAFALPVSMTEQHFYGYLVIQIDAGKLARAILGSASEEECLFVLNGEDEVILGEPFDDYRALMGVEARGVDAFIGARTLINAGGIVSQPWKVVGILRVSLFHGQQAFLRVLAGSIALALAAMLFAVLYGVRKAFKPITQLAHSVNERLGDDVKITGQDETDVISKSIDYLLESLAALRRGALTGRREVLLRQVLTHGDEPTPAFLGDVVRLALIRFTDMTRFKENYPYTQRALLRMEFERTVRDLTRRAQIDGECLDMGGDHLLLFLGGRVPEDQIRPIFAQIELRAPAPVELILGQWAHAPDARLIELYESLRRREPPLMNTEPPPEKGRWADQMIEVMDYIGAHLEDSMLSADMLAGIVGLSTNYLRTLFKEARGESLSDHIRDRRMKRAGELLKQTDLTTAEIMTRTGFTSKSSFFSGFKRYYGMTPEQYRRNDR